MRNIILVCCIFFHTVTLAQLDSVNNYCLSLNTKVSVDKNIKSFTEKVVSGTDTSVIRLVEVKNGFYKTERWLEDSTLINYYHGIYDKESSVWNYHYDENNKVIQVEGFHQKNNDTTFSVASCNYNDKGKLISYVIEDSSFIKGNKKYIDTLIYFTDDSLKYQGSFYTYFSYWYKHSSDVKYRIVLDSLYNVTKRVKYVNNKIVSDEEEVGGEVTLLRVYFYNLNGSIKMKFIKEPNYYHYYEYEYDKLGKLVKETSLDDEHKVLSTKTILYNKYGLKCKIIESSSSGDDRITLYEYDLIKKR